MILTEKQEWGLKNVSYYILIVIKNSMRDYRI